MRKPSVNVIASLALCGVACSSPTTTVIARNAYAPSAAGSPVVFTAYWQAVTFPDPMPPGSASAPQVTVPASANTAYALLAPGWDPTSATPPASFVVLQSRSGFAVALGDTLQIPIDDTTFMGNCAAGSTLSRSQADVITELVFPSVFAAYTYDAATCTTTPVGDAGAP